MGTLGMDADAFYTMTPREALARQDGQGERLKLTALAINAGFAGDMAVIDRACGKAKPRMTKERWEAMKARHRIPQRLPPEWAP